MSSVNSPKTATPDSEKQNVSHSAASPGSVTSSKPRTSRDDEAGDVEQNGLVDGSAIIESKENDATDITDLEIFAKDDAAPADQAPAQVHGCRRFLGMGLMFCASLFLSLSVVAVKALGRYHVFMISIWRFGGGCFIPCMVFALYLQFVKKNNVWEPLYPFNDHAKLKMTILVILRSITGLGGILFHLSALGFVTIAEATVVSFSTPVFVTFLAFVVLGEKFGLVNVFAAIVTLLGVIIITRPPFITGQSSPNPDVLTGVALALIAMFFSTFVFLLLRLTKDVHFAASTAIFGLVATIGSAILCAIVHKFELPDSLEYWLLVLGLSASTFLGQYFLTIAFMYEEAGPLALCRTADSIFAFIWQAIFFAISPNLYSLIGSTIVISGVVLVGVRKQISSLPPEHNCRKKCFFLLI